MGEKGGVHNLDLWLLHALTAILWSIVLYIVLIYGIDQEPDESERVLESSVPGFVRGLMASVDLMCSSMQNEPVPASFITVALFLLAAKF